MATQNEIARIKGPGLTLRLIQPEDAAYVHSLRTNCVYNKHLSEVRGTVENQCQWIEAYKGREATCDELYYIIERNDGTACGTVRLYDINKESFTWGSWILDQNKPRKAALESATLSFGVGFLGLGKNRAKVDVRKDNKHAEAFYRRLGMIETHQTEQDIFFIYTRARFEADRAGYEAIFNWTAES